MASHKSVIHIERGFRMSRTYAEQVMREHCSIIWVVKGETIRDCTREEMLNMRAEQSAARVLQEQGAERLANTEVNGLSFSPPKTTKYRFPRAAYEALELPLAGLKCRWPRMEAAC